LTDPTNDVEQNSFSLDLARMYAIFRQ
jgi:hypothetical protein